MTVPLKFPRANAERPDQALALERARAWTRERFVLAPHDTVLVAEIACGVPGCPPLETVVAFWTQGGAQRHQFKVFKPLDAVTLDDFPPAWMKGPLGVDDDAGWDCC